ncbi:phenoloxidase-activating enzyme 1-like [Drosophila kikkawai]|uniref:Phenoloxidase-activating enzyme 1-like n=1 Tax=Drosophila kikkawai TaxID=30033 RepID=A0ABM3C7Q3_DROKI
MKFPEQTLLAVLACLSLSYSQEAGEFLEEPCGLPPQRYKLVGARIALIATTPWMAIIIGPEGFRCGASLITSRFVLSAAHCLGGGPLKVRLGEYDRETERDCRHSQCIDQAQEFEVDATFIHQGYEQQRHDLALLRLALRVQYTANIFPICVLLRPSVPHLEDHIVKFSVYGWGKTESGQSSRLLRKTTLYNLNRTSCGSQYPDANINRDHICGQRFGSSTCNGDSGGPLGARIIYNRQDIMVLFGIVSFGGELCENATVFTNVMAHLNWIRNIVRLGGTF